ncbi:MAG: hypothetical protein AAF607_02425 [Pseudomonadota bacterium]
MQYGVHTAFTHMFAFVFNFLTPLMRSTDGAACAGARRRILAASHRAIDADTTIKDTPTTQKI